MIVYFREKYLNLVLAAVVMPLAIFTAALCCTSAAFGAGGKGFSRSAAIPHDPLLEPSQSEMSLAAGKFLVASRSITDPRFRETVILLLKYDSGGAMGLIINIPSTVSLRSALPEVKELRKMTGRIFIGGPVAVNRLFLLIRAKKAPDDSVHVFMHTYVSSSMAVLKRMVRDRNKGDRFRAFAGYAGWAAGQLEREVATGSWYVMAGDEKLVFEKDTSGLWQDLIGRRSGIMVRLLQDKGRQHNIAFK